MINTINRTKTIKRIIFESNLNCFILDLNEKCKEGISKSYFTGSPRLSDSCKSHTKSLCNLWIQSKTIYNVIDLESSNPDSICICWVKVVIQFEQIKTKFHNSTYFNANDVLQESIWRILWIIRNSSDFILMLWPIDNFFDLIKLKSNMN
jgi:hypothetical protein